MRLARLLLDTHALVWALTEPDRLAPDVRDAVSDANTELVVSAASAWEIATRHRLGKLSGAEALVLGYPEHLQRLGVVELAISARHALVAGGLTWAHRDPFDRMLAAQSILESLPLATADAAFASCPGVRVLW